MFSALGSAALFVLWAFMSLGALIYSGTEGFLHWSLAPLVLEVGFGGVPRLLRLALWFPLGLAFAAFLPSIVAHAFLWALQWSYPLLYLAIAYWVFVAITSWSTYLVEEFEDNRPTVFRARPNG